MTTPRVIKTKTVIRTPCHAPKQFPSVENIDNVLCRQREDHIQLQSYDWFDCHSRF